MTRQVNPSPFPTLPKTPTGIAGFDEITGGGLPSGRPSLICGSAGAGKTLFSIEFIIRGATDFKEPGVIMSFEERAIDLQENVKSLGFDLEKLQKRKLVHIDHVRVERSEIEETGEYDLDGLFIRLAHAIDSIGAKRVMLDTIENLFGGLSNDGILRAELRRLFSWLKEKGVTTLITAEKGTGTLTRHGLEEYVSDCVILLDHRIHDKISTRLLRVIKYRGSQHGTNEYPFLIDEDGISVLPITSLQLNKKVSRQRIGTGIPTLDEMLGGEGFYRGSSILVSGTAGTGKTSIASYFVHAACARNERCMMFTFEESPAQIQRNMKSIGIDLQKYVEDGLLEISAARPMLYGLEMHLVAFHKAIKKFKPSVVVLDPITNLASIGSMSEVKAMLVRLIDFLQNENITVLFTALVYTNEMITQTDEGISSLVDAWILVRDLESGGERNRGIYIMKSRGMKHSNQVREFMITDTGLKLVDVYLGADGVLVGSARETQLLNEGAVSALRNFAADSKEKVIERKRKVLLAHVESLNEEFETIKEELEKTFVEENLRKTFIDQTKAEMLGKRNNTKSGNGKNK